MQDGKHKLANNRKCAIAARGRYNAKAYDTIYLRVRKGEKEEIKQAAIQQGYQSTNSFIVAAINEKISR